MTGQGITQVIRIHPLGNMTANTKCHGHLSNIPQKRVILLSLTVKPAVSYLDLCRVVLLLKSGGGYPWKFHLQCSEEDSTVYLECTVLY